MKSKKSINFILLLTILILSTLTVFAADPVNYDYIGGVNTADLKNYIDGRILTSNNNVFCIGYDKVNYSMTFKDVEKDYPIKNGYTYALKANSTNEQLNNLFKTYKAGTLEAMYQHNPSVYQSPANKNINAGVWRKINAVYTNGQWELKNLDGSDFLIIEPTDAWRGDVTVYVRAQDDTGKAAYDKYGQGAATFRVHKAPVPIFNVVTNGNYVTLVDNGSFDIDGRYKGTAAQWATDKGIKQWYWAIKLAGEWIDIGQGKSITYNTSGKAIEDYRLTVEDYDGAFTSISKGMLIYADPIADFDYTVATNPTTYAYKGNVANETTSIQSNVIWNDDAYNPLLYATSGIRTGLWYAVKTGEYKDSSTAYVTNVLRPKFNALISSNKISTKLYVKNKFGTNGVAAFEDSVTKDLTVKNVSLIDKTSGNYNGSNGFNAGTYVKWTVELRCDQAVDDWNELKLLIDCPKLSLSNYAVIRTTTPNVFEIQLPLADIQNLWTSIPYTLKIVSNRTNELIHKIDGVAPIDTPITITGYVNGIRENIEVLTDEAFAVTAETNQYAAKAEVKFSVDVIDTRSNTKISAGNLINLDSYGSNQWGANFTIDSLTVPDTANVRVDYIATSFNGHDTATDVLFMNVIAIKIKEFNLSTIYDIRWKDRFVDNNNMLLSGSEITFSDDGTNDYTGSSAAVAKFNSYPIKFGYKLDFEVKTIGLTSADHVYIDIQAPTGTVTGLMMPTGYNSIGYDDSHFKFSVKEKNGNEITWVCSYYVPYNAIDDRVYDSTSSNPQSLTFKFKVSAQKNETRVTFFKTSDHYANIFNYYLPETARDDIYITNKN